MNLHPLFARGNRRRLVNLSNHPLFQLKLPLALLLVSSLFLVAFAAHTHAAYGKLVAVGFQDAFLAELAAEIQLDYLIVSATLGIAWCLVILGACLAVTHHFLGPIVALHRHIAQLKRGHYAHRVQVRAGHPLRTIADELDDLARLLSGEELMVLEEDDGLPGLETELADNLEARPEAQPLMFPVVSENPEAAAPWVGWYARGALTPP
jgi:hypothetical protein